MKKKLVSIFLCVAMTAALLAGCGQGENSSTDNQATTEKEAGETEAEDGVAQTENDAENAEAETENEAEEAEQESGEAVGKEVVLAAAEATVTGQGINADSEVVDTVYVPDLNAVTNMGTDSTITYTVPEGVAGKYDVYLNISKSPYAFGTTPVSVIVNNEKEYVSPADIVSCSQDFSDLFAMGTFSMIKGIDLKAGDTLTVLGKAGFEMEFGGNKVSSMSSIGDMYLYPAGAEVAVGYDGGVVEAKEEADPTDPLSGLKMVWMGSSVTFGMQSGGYTMADAIEENHAGTECLKYAISGTTLVNEGPSSYVERLKEIDPEMEMDMLIVQLSTNDATQGKTLGSLSESKEMADFDDKTIIGAMEYIIAYAEATWGCPVVFYTGTYFESPEYAAMVEALLDIQEKWGIGVVDLWNDAEMTAVYGTEEFSTYMGDDIHPVREGYVSWWTPKFEAYLSEFVAQ